VSDAQRAMDAEYILEHKLFKDAFASVEKNIIDSIKHGDMLNDNLNVKLMLSLQMLQAIEDRLRGHIADAEFAAEPIGEI